MEICYFVEGVLYGCRMSHCEGLPFNINEALRLVDIKEEHKDFYRDYWEDIFCESCNNQLECDNGIDYYNNFKILKKYIKLYNNYSYDYYFYPISKNKFWSSKYVRKIPLRLFLINTDNITDWKEASYNYRFKIIKTTINNLPWDISILSKRTDISLDNLIYFSQFSEFNIEESLILLTKDNNKFTCPIETISIRNLFIRDIKSRLKDKDNQDTLNKLEQIPKYGNIKCKKLYKEYRDLLL